MDNRGTVARPRAKLRGTLVQQIRGFICARDNAPSGSDVAAFVRANLSSPGTDR